MKRQINIWKMFLMSAMLISYLGINIQPAYAAKEEPMINLSNATIYVGRKASWQEDHVDLLVSNATQRIEWSSSNEKVATVEKGKVRAVNKGKCIITAKIGETELTCDITVRNLPENEDVQKKVKVTAKKVDNYVKITIKNKNKYPIKVNCAVGAYNFNDNLITRYGCQGYVDAGEKVHFYREYHASLQDRYGDNFYFELIDTSIDFFATSPGEITIYNTDQFSFKYSGFITETGQAFSGYKPEVSCTNNLEFDATICYNLLLYKGKELYLVEHREVSVPAGETVVAPYGLSTLSHQNGYDEEDEEYIYYNAETYEDVCEYLEGKYSVKIVPTYAYTE